ncbi:transporter substrate-binding domain-containing protein [Pseudodesulfovibrio sp. JC047]|uniref:substrate-binding periplasmic protein n=1 Tax=Pseudodesulfovibrio sp. JC047 TaxID=2683199 RepID=UPI0013D0EB7D|nr:transporter substrate-binding domain-containing protein [Pseudodesulfovibrio sp. JC047]NDV19377.1 transporter substrate-binding domain-containing protein [Pseudodesulfovibrio sp. JC047]
MLITACPVWAEDVVVAYDEYPPLNYTENGEARGDVIDRVREAGRRLGVTPIFVKQPFVRAIQEVAFRGVDGILSVVKTEEREKYLHYPTLAHFFDGPALFAHVNSGVCVSSLAETKGLNIGVIRGYRYGEGVLDSVAGNIHFVKDGETLYKMLVERRFDLGLGYRQLGTYYLDRLPGGKQVKIVLPFPQLPMYFVFAKKLGSRGKELAERFSVEMQRIQEERDTRPSR